MIRVKVRCKYNDNYDQCVDKRTNNSKILCIDLISDGQQTDCNGTFYVDWVSFLVRRNRFTEVK